MIDSNYLYFHSMFDVFSGLNSFFEGALNFISGILKCFVILYNQIIHQINWGSFENYLVEK